MEFNDVYDKYRNPTGKLHCRGTRWKYGEFGLVVCVWVYDGEGNLLLTRRAPGKSFAGTWENSGGAVKAGENSRTAIARELFEETGIRCDGFTEIGRYLVGGTAIFHCFFCTVDVDKSAVRLQEGETVDYMWLTEEEFIRFLRSDKVIESQIRRYRPYYEKMGYMK